MKKLNILLLFFCLIQLGISQVSVTPVFPGVDDNITVFFNAAEGNAALKGFNGDVYAHTGVITDLSTSATDWKYVVSAWASADAKVKMTRVSADLYKLVYNIRTYYAIPAGVIVKKLAFVFRSVDGNTVGRSSDGSDIYYDVVAANAALAVKIIKPTAKTLVVKQGDIIDIQAASSKNGVLTITDNGSQIATASNAKDITNLLTVSQAGSHTVEFKCVAGAETNTESFTYINAPNVTIANPPTGLVLGWNKSTVDTTSMILLLDAPGKSFVYVIGSFNNWVVDGKYLMNKSVNGNQFWLKIDGLNFKNNIFYQYLIDGAIKIADPLSELVLNQNSDGSISNATFNNIPSFPTQTSGTATWIRPNANYVWKTNSYSRPAKGDLVVYELLVRDFSNAKNFQNVIDSIKYLKNLGINAIELMPVNEFDGNESWGYNPTFHMALDKAYGTPEKLKELVDICHANGIAIIVDIVFNQAHDNSPLVKMYNASSNPWINATARHPYNVFYDMNHESVFTRSFVKRCLQYWLEEYKIDGYRFDLAKGFTQKQSNDDASFSAYDQSRVDILTDYHNTVQSTTPGAYTILELFSTNSEESVLINSGMMTWGNMNGVYNESSKGYNNNNMQGVTPKSRGWNTPSLIGYMESHDEERQMYGNLNSGNSLLNYNVKEFNTALSRVELTSSFFYTLPGPKMLWMFGELGYDYSINFNGRVGNKPVRWDYFQNYSRRRLYNVVADLIDLRSKYTSVFNTNVYDLNELTFNKYKSFHLKDINISFTIMGNFDVEAADVIPNFQNTGKWYEFFTGDSISVADVAKPINFLPGEYRIYTNKKIAAPKFGYVKFNVSTKNIDDYINDFDVSPNPSSDHVVIQYNLKNAANVSLQILDITGKVLMSKQVKSNQGANREDMMHQLSDGTYLVSLFIENQVITQKIVVGK
jgi:1,4-alpha-glucan branching enzyme